MFAGIASLIFVLGYLLIVLETKAKISKSALALWTGGILWVLLALSDFHALEEKLIDVGSDIFNLVAFLLAAMSLVEIAAHYRLFDFIRSKLSKYRFSDVAQLWVLSIIAFFLSAVLDNLTTTIVMIQIASKFFKGRNMLVASSAIVIAANAGGAFSPIGDVTTIMLWLAHKFNAGQIIAFGIIPSLCIFGISTFLLGRKVNSGDEVGSDEIEEFRSLSKSELTVLIFVGLSFILPLLVKIVHLPPVIGILLGLGLTWIMVDLFKQTTNHETHMTASIEHLIQKSDLGSIKFFIGIILAVSALGAFGVLDMLSHFLYADATSVFRIVGANTLLGIISAVLDNIPLTAIAIEILKVPDYHLWVQLALAVGTGGSLLSLGSAAGVVAMGMVKELTFAEYFKIAFVPALVGFLGGMFIWCLQFMLIGGLH